MLERIRKAVSFAAEDGITVAFFGVDSLARRARVLPPRLRGCRRGGRAGGRRRRHARDRDARRRPRTSSAGRVDWLGSTFPSTGTATTTSASRTAAPSPPSRPARPGCTGTVNGMGERAGNADLLEVALALEALYGIPTRLDLTQARALAALVQRALRLRRSRRGSRSPATPLHARDRRGREPSSTIRRRSSRTRPSSSAPSAGSCSARRAASTRSGSRPSELGLDVPEERRAELLAAVKQLGTEKRRPRHRRRVRGARRERLSDVNPSQLHC